MFPLLARADKYPGLLQRQLTRVLSTNRNLGFQGKLLAGPIPFSQPRQLVLTDVHCEFRSVHPVFLAKVALVLALGGFPWVPHGRMLGLHNKELVLTCSI